MTSSPLDRYFKSVSDDRIIVEVNPGRVFTLKKWTWKERQKFYTPYLVAGKIPPGGSAPIKPEDNMDFQNDLIAKSIEKAPEGFKIGDREAVASLEDWVEGEALLLAAVRLNLHFLLTRRPLSGPSKSESR